MATSPLSSSSSSPPHSSSQKHPPTSQTPQLHVTTLCINPPPPPSSSSSPKIQIQSHSPPRKPQVIPWTHEETVNLIKSYQEKWYSLKRGQLKASQWEEVAITVTAHCGLEEPSKSGTQCRHKIEKLRKRYRAEKQKPYPNAWVYFDLMDQMEEGPMPISVVLPSKSRRFGERDNDDDDDYNPSSKVSEIQGRKFETRLRERKIHEFGEMVDGFLRGGRKMSQFNERVDRLSNSKGVRKMGNEAGPKRFASDTRFMKTASGFGMAHEYSQEEAEEEDDVEVEEGEDGNGGNEDRKSGRRIKSEFMLMQLAGQMKEFADRFVKMERKKMEMMRETERQRMEMEKRRMEMIHVSQQKTVEFINRAFGFGSHSQKKLKFAEE